MTLSPLSLPLDFRSRREDLCRRSEKIAGRSEMKGRSMPPDLATDAYGFAIRPQHLQRYQQYSKIYKEEEEERSERWKHFLERLAESGETPLEGLPSEEANGGTPNEDDKRDDNLEEMVSSEMEKMEKAHNTRMWAQTRPSLGPIEQMMSFRVKKLKTSTTHEEDKRENDLDRIEEESPLNGASVEESEDEFYDVERSSFQEMKSSSSGGDSREPIYPWKEELKCLVHGGVPMALRGELWQAFVGVRTRRLEGYYHNLLAPKANIGDDQEHGESTKSHGGASENWKGQIEKDLPRTFPGHPALDEGGRNALRRLLTAYARHNPSVGYCQAMNFFAGLLLLLMPEENAFWVFLGIIDDYFDGYYSEEMIESQVDQLVFEELMLEKFPKLVNHLDYLGLHVAWATGPWFLSIFANMLPWESVLRVWDVLLFDGNRVMLFRTAFALMELYGPSIVIAKDAGDAITLLQSLTGSTFDSSQLVLTACMGYQAINETKLQEFRKKHRPAVLVAMEERCRGLCTLKDSQGLTSLTSKLYNCKHDPGSLLAEIDSTEGLGNTHLNPSTDAEGILHTESDSIPYLKEQVMCLKSDLCKVVKDKQSAILRAEELETALIEMVKQDNRRILSAKVEQLEREECELRQTLAEKQEQEHVMVQILMRMEQEQKVTEDARLRAEQDVTAQQSAAHVLKEIYEETMTLLGQMEKRAVMAETMLEATLQYQSSQAKAQQPPPSPRYPNINQDTSQDVSTKKLS